MCFSIRSSRRSTDTCSAADARTGDYLSPPREVNTLQVTQVSLENDAVTPYGCKHANVQRKMRPAARRHTRLLQGRSTGHRRMYAYFHSGRGYFTLVLVDYTRARAQTGFFKRLQKLSTSPLLLYTTTWSTTRRRRLPISTLSGKSFSTNSWSHPARSRQRHRRSRKKSRPTVYRAHSPPAPESRVKSCKTGKMPDGSGWTRAEEEVLPPPRWCYHQRQARSPASSNQWTSSLSLSLSLSC